MSRDCSKCGTPNADEARFCRACGGALTAPAAAARLPCRACGHPNLAGARFCARCGTDQTTPSPPPAPVALPAAASGSANAARPMGRWIGLGAIVVIALVAGGAWWMNQARSPANPRFDAAPPPAVLDASSGPSASAPASSEAAASAAAPPTLPMPVPPNTSGASAASGETGGQAGKSAATAKPPEKEPQTATDQAARDAKAKALREQRQLAASQAATERTRRHAEDTGTRPVPHAPVSHPAAAVPAAPEPGRSVQARCTGRNAILQGLCEARECIRKENANDAVCQRIRADAEQRRQ
jgi:hypothetical protein